MILVLESNVEKQKKERGALPVVCAPPSCRSAVLQSCRRIFFFVIIRVAFQLSCASSVSSHPSITPFQTPFSIHFLSLHKGKKKVRTMRACMVWYRAAMCAGVCPALSRPALRCSSSIFQAQLLCSNTVARAGDVVAPPLAVQRRTQYAQNPGKREQEAFLTQFDPLEVLGLEPDCNVEDIDAAFERMKGKYAPNGPSPDAKMVERVFRAHEILKDPDSPYYLKAHSSQTDRQRLQFQLLPKSKRRFIELQVCFLMLIVVGIAVLTVKLILRPMNRSIRAATR
jgi:hypothetical protein